MSASRAALRGSRGDQEVLGRGLSDPRIRGLITVTEVQVSADRRNAGVYVSCSRRTGPSDDAACVMRSVTSGTGRRDRADAVMPAADLSPRRSDPQGEVLRAINLAARTAQAQRRARGATLVSIARSDRLLAFVARAPLQAQAPPNRRRGSSPRRTVVVELLGRSWSGRPGRESRGCPAQDPGAGRRSQRAGSSARRIVSMLGPEDCRARACRAAAGLAQQVYAQGHDMPGAPGGRRHATSAATSKRSGMHPFVAARVGLLCFGSQDFPLDTRLRDAIARSRAVPSDQPAPEISLLLAGLIPPGELASAYVAIEAHAEMQAPKRPSETRRRAPKAAPAVRKPAETRPKRSGRKPAKGAPTER